jgi:large subunit ribosomal protein L21
MRAIIETGGAQVPVETDAKCKIPRVNTPVGDEIDFDRVLLISTDGKPTVGNPYIEGAVVHGEVIAHGRFDKVTVFKFKRRRKYRRRTGHKQAFTEILIKKISHK